VVTVRQDPPSPLIFVALGLLVGLGSVVGLNKLDDEPKPSAPTFQTGSGEEPVRMEVIATDCIVYRGGEDIEYVTVCDG
jgi:hypothetical protein